ncbi:pleckstrin homology domain-containing family M member 1-like isoform X1 [Branchiostoma lanceolatum]|uniref:pleckstrin homology domain-containing family M member 1-like isoform X1 n=1 Tax=Branchiostoma lanceolatum TaxID=7740 RepID=UPI003456454B
MNFLKGSGPTEDEKAEHRVIKHTLSSQLSRTIKRLQQEHIGSDSAVRSGDHGNAICNVLEAIFLHGLKASFATKISGMFGSGKEEKGPVMSFWPFVMHFTHKDVVSQLNHLAHITTEIGQCRAWIRLALNDGLMESYAEAMLRDKDLLRSHYRSIAYLRDEEHPTIMKNHLQGLEGFQFQLSYNSSVLNDWGVSSLTLAGLWSPQQAPEAVTPTSPDVAMEATEGDDPTLPSQQAAKEVRQVRSTRKGQRSSRKTVDILDPEGDPDPVESSITMETGDTSTEQILYDGKRTTPVESTSSGTQEKDTSQVLLRSAEPSSYDSENAVKEVEAENEVSSGDSQGIGKMQGVSASLQSPDNVQTLTPSSQTFENVTNHQTQVSMDPTPASNSVATPSSAVYQAAGTVEKVGGYTADNEENLHLSRGVQSSVETQVVQHTLPAQSTFSLPLQTSEQPQGTQEKETRSETLTSQDMFYDIYSRSRTETEASITSPSSNDEGENTVNIAAYSPAQQASQQQEQTSAESMESEESVAGYGSYGNSLGVRSGWSSAGTKDSIPPDPGRHRAPSSSRGSFDSLLKNYSPQGSLATTPGMQEILETLAGPDAGLESQLEPQEPDNSHLEESDELDREEFEVLPLGSSVTSGHADPRTKELMAQLTSIGREKGLDVQNFKCKECERQIGLIFGKYRVCNYDGCYYCEECHVNEEAVIPARIILNWDFKKHKIAHSTKLFLLQVDEEPLINLEECNPDIYTYIKEMSEVKTLRLQLKYVKAYLFTCNQSVAEDLRKRVWPKDYMLDRIHLYSVVDLLQVTSGQLQQHLKKVVKHATKHVYKCQLCSQKGFLCEVCNSPNPIYPFETESTVRCDRCKAVFHAKCRSENRACPKCTRRDLRRSQFRTVEDTSPDFTFPV